MKTKRARLNKLVLAACRLTEKKTMKNTTYIARSLLRASPSPQRSRAWAFLLSAAAILTLLLSTASSSFAGSATWLASPATGDWNTATNWTAGGPPNGPSDMAFFATSNTTALSLSANTEVNVIVFNSGASAFTITASPTFTLTISGTGITNNSGIQNFVTAVDGFGFGNYGRISFFNSATAGSLTMFTNNGGTVINGTGGHTEFFNTSTAGTGTFTNNSETSASSEGGFTRFSDTSTAGNGTFTNNGGGTGGFAFGAGFTEFDSDASTAGNGTFINNGGAASGTSGGFTRFFKTSTAGNATLIANGGPGRR